eukprot:jgi/Chlat1/4856/Chrsp31S04884
MEEDQEEEQAEGELYQLEEEEEEGDRLLEERRIREVLAARETAAARRLGLHPVHDADLLWVAEEIAARDLPDGWHEYECNDEQGRNGGLRFYYHDERTGHTQWSHPEEERYRSIVFMHKEGRQLLAEHAYAMPPTPEETRAMALYLGIHPEEEAHLMGVAKAAVSTPLPPGWEECEDDTGEVCYYNRRTGVAQRSHPLDAFFLTLVRVNQSPLSSHAFITTLPQHANFVLPLFPAQVEEKRVEWRDAYAGGNHNPKRFMSYHLINEGSIPVPWLRFHERGPSKTPYYYNFATKETAYCHPCELARADARTQAAVWIQAHARGWLARRKGDKQRHVGMMRLRRIAAVVIQGLLCEASVGIEGEAEADSGCDADTGMLEGMSGVGQRRPGAISLRGRYRLAGEGIACDVS